MKALVVGCGYLGQRVARLWQTAGAEVHVVTRSKERAREFAAQGFLPLVAEIMASDSLVNLPQVDSVLFAVGYDRNSSVPIGEVYAPGLANVLDSLPAGTGRVIYISSTGVYGPAEGEWVDELTPPNPQRAGGHASLAAEQVLAAQQIGASSVILRLAGIYGSGRIPYLDKLRAGEPLAVPSEGWLNLIHVDDAAEVVLAACRWAESCKLNSGPEVFCVSDGSPVVRGDYYREVARLIGSAEPRFVSPSTDSPAALRARSDKRISNRKMMEILSIKLQHSKYREGLAAILAG
ncbi:SDR family oxidoreductase [Bythopirellula polymerisocia]|uniref:NAD dependent epimerase/dehydratase family protein n=1 Tax=Bythopirellula polymerisocia TaxID=2528003 RepID=A0A5C6CCU0_9BACT|nr:SDR family oxidoreductase [Bythopirellula polymerisocia]TWU21932.1 NAD dependent epimerase/dehydratase family protein [Bythopirellula polymerisocia]